jgi:drug/metabolite transporter (DMT)-like permease
MADPRAPSAVSPRQTTHALAGVLALLLAVGALLGLSVVLARQSARMGTPPVVFLAWSASGAAVLLVAQLTWARAWPRLTARVAEYFGVAAFVSFAAPMLLLFAATPSVGAGFASLGLAFPPLLTYIGACALGIERFVARRFIGVLLALLGVATLAWFKLRVPDAAAWAVAATLLAPVFLAIGNLYRSLRWPQGAAPEQLAPGMLVAAAVMVGLGAFAWQGSLWPHGASTAWWALAGVQALAFAWQYRLFFRLQKVGGPVLLSLIGSVSALTAVPISVALLGEDWPQGLAAAAVLIAAGMVLLLGGQRRP